MIWATVRYAWRPMHFYCAGSVPGRSRNPGAPSWYTVQQYIRLLNPASRLSHGEFGDRSCNVRVNSPDKSLFCLSKPVPGLCRLFGARWFLSRLVKEEVMKLTLALLAVLGLSPMAQAQTTQV